MVADRKPMHKRCLKCDRCHKVLTPANLNTMVEEAKIFCQNCYNDAVMASLVELLFNKSFQHKFYSFEGWGEKSCSRKS